MKSAFLLKYTIATAALALSVAPALRANLVVDGNFQTDNGGQPGLDGDAWTLFQNSGFDGSYTGGPTGSFWNDGAVGSEGILSQTLATTAGQPYTISLLINPDGGYVDEDTVWWDGNVVFDQSYGGNSTGVDYWVNGVAGGSLTYGGDTWNSVVIDPLAVGNDVLSIGVRNDPAFDSVTGISVDNVPDAGMSALMLGFSLLALLGLRRSLATAS